MICAHLNALGRLEILVVHLVEGHGGQIVAAHVVRVVATVLHVALAELPDVVLAPAADDHRRSVQWHHLGTREAVPSGDAQHLSTERHGLEVLERLRRAAVVRVSHAELAVLVAAKTHAVGAVREDARVRLARGHLHDAHVGGRCVEGGGAIDAVEGAFLAGGSAGHVARGLAPGAGELARTRDAAHMQLAHGHVHEGVALHAEVDAVCEGVHLATSAVSCEAVHVVKIGTCGRDVRAPAHDVARVEELARYGLAYFHAHEVLSVIHGRHVLLVRHGCVAGARRGRAEAELPRLIRTPALVLVLGGHARGAVARVHGEVRVGHLDLLEGAGAREVAGGQVEALVAVEPELVLCPVAHKAHACWRILGRLAVELVVPLARLLHAAALRTAEHDHGATGDRRRRGRSGADADG
mmetsp:Transcript_14244/g.38379  ORF Transcript_14244/g.38379 Transcript_14244/m.38379 type:complete len:411 (-) Transcript_14244:248-1480(-)